MARLGWLALLTLSVIATSSGVAQEPCADLGVCPVRDEGCGVSSRWQAGADALMLVPRFESNPAYFVTRRALSIVGPPTNSQSVEEFSYDLSVSPRIWLSYTSDSGFGGRVRWFHFDDSANPRQVVNPAIPIGSQVAFQSISSTSPLMAISPQTSLPAVNSIQTQSPFGVNDQLRFTSSLRIDTTDVEATFSDLRTGAWNFEVFGGVRYTSIEQKYDGNSQGFPSQFITSRQTFDGTGPSIGFGGKRRLGDYGVSAYGVGRIAFLFGKDEHVTSGLNIGLIPDFTYAFHANNSSRQRTLPVIEYEFGAEGSYSLRTAEAFLRLGVFTQLIPLGSGPNGNGNAGLIGVLLGTGVRF